MKIAIHGLGRMGMQIARKLTEAGHDVYAHNRSPESIEKAVSYGCKPALTKQDVIAAFNGEPVVVWVMLPADVSAVEIITWSTLLASGSIIVNGANADFRTTIQLNKTVTAAGQTLVDVGVSGGIWGYERGFPLMVGCDDESTVHLLASVFDDLSNPGGAWGHFGPSGTGNYVKMVHNAIEYGMMQSLAEGYRMLHESPFGLLDMAKAGDIWQHHSVIESWLNDLTRQAVTEDPDLKNVHGYVAESGEAKWMLETAKERDIQLPAIQAAFDVRLASQQGHINFATKIVAAQRNKFGGHNLNGEGKA